MTTGVSGKTTYRYSEENFTAESWLGSKPSVRPKIIAFIGSGDHTGISLAASVASAISTLDKRVRVLHVANAGYGEELTVEDIGLLPTDYLLVDLPFQPTSFARSILSCCDLILVASSCKFDFLAEAENVIKVLLFLGLDMEKVAGVLVDPEGILSCVLLAEIKPYLESSLGIAMAGVVSFGKDEGSQLKINIEQLAQYIK